MHQVNTKLNAAEDVATSSSTFMFPSYKNIQRDGRLHRSGVLSPRSTCKVPWGPGEQLTPLKGLPAFAGEGRESPLPAA